MTRYFLGITGASGHAYAEALLRALVAAEHTVDVCVTEAGAKVMRHELGIDPGDHGELLAANLCAWLGRDIAAHVRAFDARGDRSAAFVGHGARRRRDPVSVQHGHAGARVGRLQLESRRSARRMSRSRKAGRLLLVPRETPLSQVHLENMLRLARLGAVILPAMPGFYHHPRTVEDLVDHVVGKILDRLGIENQVGARWKGGTRRRRSGHGRAAGSRSAVGRANRPPAREAHEPSASCATTALVRFSAIRSSRCRSRCRARGSPRAESRRFEVLLLDRARAVAARTAAMAFNRLVDRDIDAKIRARKAANSGRALCRARACSSLVAVELGVFVAVAFQLNPLCGKLAPPVLLLLFAYS